MHFCSNVTLQRAPKFAKSTILKTTFGNQSRDLLVLTQKWATITFRCLQYLGTNNVHVQWTLSTHIVCVRLYSGASGQAKRSSNSINSSSFMRFRKWNFLDKKHLSSCITGQKQSFPWILGNRLGCASEVGAASFGWTLALKPVGLRAWSQVCPGARDSARNGRRQHWETTCHSSSGKAIRAH